MSKWIEWNGGKMPVPKGTPIWVRHRNGEEFKAKAGDYGAVSWTHDLGACGYDIIAYKLRKNWRFNDGTQPDCKLVDLIFSDGCLLLDAVDDYGFGWDSVVLWRPAKSLKANAGESAPEGEQIPPKEGWNVNTGFMPDLPSHSLIDVIFKAPYTKESYRYSVDSMRWSLHDNDGDILYWRIHDPYRELREAQDAGRLVVNADGSGADGWLRKEKTKWCFIDPVDLYKIIPLELSDKLRETYNAYQDSLKQVKEYK